MYAGCTSGVERPLTTLVDVCWLHHWRRGSVHYTSECMMRGGGGGGEGYLLYNIGCMILNDPTKTDLRCIYNEEELLPPSLFIMNDPRICDLGCILEEGSSPPPPLIILNGAPICGQCLLFTWLPSCQLSFFIITTNTTHPHILHKS